jgi:L-threonylcarbamoyladenylate synthase
MSVVPVDTTYPDAAVIADAAARLQAGQLVAFPTETVYGLGANALDPAAVQRIYAAKGRPAWNPVIAHVPSIEAARALAREWPASAQVLAEAFWPGPLTLVVPKAAHVPEVATAGLDAVAVRVPAHPVALALLRAAAMPIAAPSANRFTQISPTTAWHVVQSLGDRVPLVLDGGPCSVGIESTVVDCTGEEVIILRPGMLGRESLERVLAPLGIPVRKSRTRSSAGMRNGSATAGTRSPCTRSCARARWATATARCPTTCSSASCLTIRPPMRAPCTAHCTMPIRRTQG